MACKEDVACAKLASAYALQITPGPDKPILPKETLRGTQNIGGDGNTDPKKMDATGVALTGARYATAQVYSLIMGTSGIIAAQNKLIAEGLRQNSDIERKKINPQSIRQIGMTVTTPHDETAALISTWLVQNVFKVGNCQELAYAAYMFLRNVSPGPKATPHVATLGVEHAFVILGEVAKGTHVYELESSDIIICDPWLGRKAQFYKFQPGNNYEAGVFSDLEGLGVPKLFHYESVLTSKDCGGSPSYANLTVGIAI